MGLAETFKGVIDRMVAQSRITEDRVLTPDNVYQEKHEANRELVYPLIRQLLTDDSGIEGLENLVELGELSRQGHACLILSEHLGNFDVPTFWTLMRSAGPAHEELFDRIVFIAGRKLNEESAVVKLFTEMFTRIVISPKTFYENLPAGEEKERLAAEAQAINIAAYRKIRELKAQKRMLLVYPTGTRFRPWEPATGRGLREVEAYLRSFEYFIVAASQGNLMPPEKDVVMADETPKPGRVVLRFGAVRACAGFRREAIAEYGRRQAAGAVLPDDKQFVIDRIMEEIAALHG